MSNSRKVGRAENLSFLDFRYLITAIIELALARIRFAATPAQEVVRSLEKRSRSTNCKLSADESSLDLHCISWAIEAASARVPWRSDCLIQAMAADRWLYRHGLVGDFYLGVKQNPSEPFTAHAWMRCSGITVTGGICDEYLPLIEPPTR